MFKKAIIAALAMIGAQAIKIDSSVLQFGSKGMKGLGRTQTNRIDNSWWQLPTVNT